MKICETSYKFNEDKKIFLRNPGMGWVVYIDAFEEDGFPNAEEFWNSMKDYDAHASIFYVRIPWSQVEPEEGKYAWIYDDNYRKVIQTALDRGLKLAFRIYVDGKFSYQQATPEFVKQAGCKGYTKNPADCDDTGYTVNPTDGTVLWTPYVDDKIFQEKFSNFVKAFGKEYDDPDKVDFIDGGSLGWWGEMHNIDYMTIAQSRIVFKWITNLYMDNFKHVLLGDQYGENSFAFELHDEMLKKGWVIRRDSLGSKVCFNDSHKARILHHWPKNPFFVENCFHHFDLKEKWWKAEFATLRDCLLSGLSDVEQCHGNTFDLRFPDDAKIWCEQFPDLVEEYALKLGYRLVIEEMEINPSDSALQIKSLWKNEGIGRLPNSSLNWNMKYKLAYALYDCDKDKITSIVTDNATDIGVWVKGNDYHCESSLSLENISAGNYKLVFAIVDTTKQNSPAIRLAIKSNTVAGGWYVAGNITI